MRFHENGFELVGNDEPLVAREALDHQIFEAHKKGNLVQPQTRKLRIELKFSDAVTNDFSRADLGPYICYLYGALEDYVVSDPQILNPVKNAAMSPEDIEFFQRIGILERNMARAMISCIEQHLGVPTFDQWVAEVTPADFLLHDPKRNS